jgi:hypothetical protein
MLLRELLASASYCRKMDSPKVVAAKIPRMLEGSLMGSAETTQADAV